MIQRYQVRKALKRIGVEGHRLITWVFHPYQRHYCQILQQNLLIYEVSDEYHEYAGVRHKKRRVSQIRNNEQLILKKANIIFATAANLHRRLASQHSNVFFIPNGADVEHFVRKPHNVSIPPELENVGRPIIGFVGKINEQIDYSLINKLAINHPEWSLVFLGNFDGQRSLKHDPAFLKTESNSNLYFLGWQDYDQLPRYVHAFDVCVIPFVINALTQSVYPLKLHEYLAAGKPVVSTDLPEVRPFDGIIRIAHDQDEFEHQVAAALEERDEDLCQRRMAVARENSWEQRAEQILSILEQSMLLC